MNVVLKVPTIVDHVFFFNLIRVTFGDNISICIIDKLALLLKSILIFCGIL